MSAPRFVRVASDQVGLSVIIDDRTGFAAELLGVPCNSVADGDVPFTIEALEYEASLLDDTPVEPFVIASPIDEPHAYDRGPNHVPWWVPVAAFIGCALIVAAGLTLFVLAIRHP